MTLIEAKDISKKFVVQRSWLGRPQKVLTAVEKMSLTIDALKLWVDKTIADGKIAGANILDSYRISGIVKNYMLRLFAGDREKLPNYQLAKLKLAGVTKEFIEELEGALNG